MYQRLLPWVECFGYRIYHLFLVGLDGDGEIIAYYDGSGICLEHLSIRISGILTSYNASMRKRNRDEFKHNPLYACIYVIVL